MVGGAETLVVNSLTKGGLQQYTDNVLVYFYGTSPLENKIDPGVKVICLNYKGIWDLPRVLLRLREIVKKNKINIVHSHLNPAGFYTRLALPRRIKQVHTLHTTYSLNTSTRPFLLWLEKIILLKNKNVSLIFLSEYLKKDFFAKINFKGKSFVLGNFIEDVFFYEVAKNENVHFKVVAVGNLNPQKNYLYLFEIFKYLKDLNISLDIYGGGNIEEYQAKILRDNLNIQLMGQQHSIPHILPHYDLFIMPSNLEGYPIAVLEAMASGIPCMLSDIDALKNIAGDNAIYFPLSNAGKAAETIKEIANKNISTASFIKKGKQLAKAAKRSFYLEKLLRIYTKVTREKVY